METNDSRPHTSSGEESEMRVGGAEFQVERLEMPAEEEDTKHNPQTLSKAGNWFRRRIGRNILSPAFLVMLMISFSMWYLIKLNKNYTTDIDVRVDIAGHEMVVSCRAEGKGTDLLISGRGRRRTIHLEWNELDVVPSLANPGYVTVSSESLKNAISIGRPNIKIISIGAVPEVEL